MMAKGVLPLLILQVLARKPNYGYQILADLRRDSEGVLDYNEGALYPVLYQLERNGDVESYTEDAEGRVRRFYRLTRQGQLQLAATAKAWSVFTRGVSLILNRGET